MSNNSIVDHFDAVKEHEGEGVAFDHKEAVNKKTDRHDWWGGCRMGQAGKTTGRRGGAEIS
jgi:hypothetical protein